MHPRRAWLLDTKILMPQKPTQSSFLTKRQSRRGKFLVVVALLLGTHFAQAKNEHSWDKIDYRENLYFTRDQEIARGENVAQKNADLLEEIKNFRPTSNGRAEGVTFAQAQKILSMISKNEITGSRGDRKYDPDGSRGFCFGRALYAHLELLRHGVDAASIKKVFIVGPMKAGGINWQFHVATIVRAKDKDGWYALDTVVGEPVLLDQWLARFLGFSSDKKLRMYITRAAKIGPSSWEYNKLPGGLFDPFYNEYFKDMFEMFRKQPVKAEDKFVLRCSRIFS